MSKAFDEKYIAILVVNQLKKMLKVVFLAE
ncbi:hypothetical protein BAPKO_4518 (plasmid) [Borreliella afzelii PKo]|nr:hypothetical protein BAPKO_4518 [Borreliella afzelii PKo]